MMNAEEQIRFIQSKKRDVSDTIYGQINLPEIAWRIIDTTQFQRLQKIKQLSTCYMVYPGANHTRKEHSMGVCYLAGVLLKKLRENHLREGDPLDLTDNEVLMVQIAGLCHDLGHGPLSHTFDGIFMQKVNDRVTDYKHEKSSVLMFRRLLEQNKDVARELKLICPNDEDLIFIEEMLSGIPHETGTPDKGDMWPFKGRGPEKAYLYELISNSRCGIDVDRLDYIRRDANYCTIEVKCALDRMFENTRVLQIINQQTGNCQQVLGFRDKIVNDISHVGESREDLHRQVYQHKTTKNIEMMVVDALLLVNDELLFKGDNGKMVKLSDTINDMSAFEKTDDSVLDEIRKMAWRSENPTANVLKANEILDDVERRALYIPVGQFFVSDDDVKINPMMAHLLKDLKQSSLETSKAITDGIANQYNGDTYNLPTFQNNLTVAVSDIHYGMKEKDPLSNCAIYSKHNPKIVIRGNDRYTLNGPKRFRSFAIRVFCTERDDRDFVETAKICFKMWCSRNGVRSQRMTDELLNPDLYDNESVVFVGNIQPNTPPLSPYKSASSSYNQ